METPGVEVGRNKMLLLLGISPIILPNTWMRAPPAIDRKLMLVWVASFWKPTPASVVTKTLTKSDLLGGLIVYADAARFKICKIPSRQLNPILNRSGFIYKK
jgi:hypothetical protein